tara:strand:- start:234 stop:602 length:369 start_codon:yes stop_codon:yes gene_type:complete
MKQIKEYNLKELTLKIYDLVSITSVEIGHKTDGKTMAALSKIFASDLIKENLFKNLYLYQIKDAFRLGVRFGKDEPFLNIRTFYKWVYAHKKVVDYAEHQVHKLNVNPKQVPYYHEPKKLLK